MANLGYFSSSLKYLINSFPKNIERILNKHNNINIKIIMCTNADSSNNVKLSKLELDSSPLSSNAWLAGFIESDGNFYCGFYLNSDGIAKIVKCYMRISAEHASGFFSATPDKTKIFLI